MIYEIAPKLQKSLFAKKTRAAFLLAAAALALPCLAWGDDDDVKKAPAEIDWQLPAAPVSENLLPFYTSPFTKQSFTIDAKSLTVDTDGVIRYTIVSTSAGGAKNISYEGIRCSTYERRIYAIGHADGSWAKTRDSEWQLIPAQATNLQHAELAKNYFCSGTSIAGKAEQILQAIHYRRTDLPNRL